MNLPKSARAGREKCTRNSPLLEFYAAPKMEVQIADRPNTTVRQIGCFIPYLGALTPG
jgi:hypothetical protein